MYKIENFETIIKRAAVVVLVTKVSYILAVLLVDLGLRDQFNSLTEKNSNEVNVIAAVGTTRNKFSDIPR